MKKITKLGILTLFLVTLVSSVFAFPGGFRNEDVQAALESGDYEAWKEAMTAGLTEERFNKSLERYERKAEIKAAMEEGYDAWAELVSEHPRGEKLLEVINEDNFDRYVEMHDAIEDGDHETAKEIAKELGLKGIRRGHFKGKPHKKG